MKTEKNAFIEAEIKRLITKLCGDTMNTQREFVKPLIERIAFNLYMLTELEAEIKAKGTTYEYQNGREQYGTTSNPAVKLHNSTMTIYLKAIKQLADILFKDAPQEERQSKLDEFRNAFAD